MNHHPWPIIQSVIQSVVRGCWNLSPNDQSTLTNSRWLISGQNFFLIVRYSIISSSQKWNPYEPNDQYSGQRWIAETCLSRKLHH